MKITSILVSFLLITFLSFYVSCGSISEEQQKEIIDQILDLRDDPTPVPTKTPETFPSPSPTIEPVPSPSTMPTLSPIPSPSNPINEASYYIPDNCINPPKQIAPNDGFKCMASNTRGGTIVCILPYQFTWKPWREWTDHHGVTMKCNKNDDHFDTVKLILKSGKEIPLTWDKCQNYVGTKDGKIGRQHWRHASERWDRVKGNVVKIEMIKQESKTCLRF